MPNEFTKIRKSIQIFSKRKITTQLFIYSLKMLNETECVKMTRGSSNSDHFNEVKCNPQFIFVNSNSPDCLHHKEIDDVFCLVNTLTHAKIMMNSVNSLVSPNLIYLKLFSIIKSLSEV